MLLSGSKIRLGPEKHNSGGGSGGSVVTPAERIYMDSERKKIHAFVDLMTDAEIKFLVSFLARILNLG